jgi:translation initiation factor IF-3
MKRIELEVNEEISEKVFDLVDLDGKITNGISKTEALKIAEEKACDLVLVMKSKDPKKASIVKMVESAGKMIYNMEKKQKKMLKNAQETIVKKLQLRPNTDIGDVQLRIKQAREFLKKRAKITFMILYKKRELSKPEKGIEKLKEVANTLSDVAKVASEPKVEGLRAYMVLVNKD